MRVGGASLLCSSLLFGPGKARVYCTVLHCTAPYQPHRYRFRISRLKYSPVPGVDGALATFALLPPAARQKVPSERAFMSLVRTHIVGVVCGGGGRCKPLLMLCTPGAVPARACTRTPACTCAHLPAWVQLARSLHARPWQGAAFIRLRLQLASPGQEDGRAWAPVCVCMPLYPHRMPPPLQSCVPVQAASTASNAAAALSQRSVTARRYPRDALLPPPAPPRPAPRARPARSTRRSRSGAR